MHIGIDARELTGHPTGVGRYLSGLLRQWAGSGTETYTFTLYAHRPLPPQHGWPFAQQVLTGKGGSVWEQVTLSRALKRDKVDAFFSPGYTCPLLSGIPTTVAIHDVSFCAHPEWFSPREGARRRFLTRRSAALAGTVITISEFSRREIVKYLGADDRKIAVIPPGIDPPAPPDDRDVSRGDRVLFVGSIFNRRNIPQLVEAVARLGQARPTVGLDLIGDNRSRPEIDLRVLIARQPHPERLRWHQYVDDRALRDHYAAAGAFAFLSEYEGLGLTPLEAMSAGVPPVLLDTAVARESCGDGALYVRLGDTAGTAAALEAALFDDVTRARLRAAAPAVLDRYDWPTAAARTLAAIIAA